MNHDEFFAHRLGKNLKHQRLGKHLSVQMVAERSGVSENVIFDIERGDINAKLGDIINILFALGLEKTLLRVAQTNVTFLS